MTAGRLLMAALIVSAAIVWAARAVLAAMERARAEAARGRALQVLAAFAPAIREAQADPAALLTWQPLALAARKLLPDEFAAADAAAGGSFPFTPDQIRDAHSQWTAAWLAWEQAHDAEYKRRAAESEHALSASGGSPLERARLEAVEREKLETYQRRYEEYIRVARKLQALFS